MPASDAPRRPNLVFILPDRLRRDSMACYGNDWIQSPRMNALAGQSFVFDHCYVTQPVCAPARASILTGLYPVAAGVPVNRLVMPPEVRTIAEMVPDGYRTGYVGKWHLGDELTAQHGFDEWVASNDNWWPEYTRVADQQRFSDYHHFLVEHGIEPDAGHPGGKTFSGRLRASLRADLQMASFVGNRSAEFIECNADRPFILYASTVEPHPPFTGPYDGLYDPATLPVEETFLQLPEQSSRFNRLRADLFGNCVRDGIDLTEGEVAWRRLRANYWGNVKLVDDMLGTILGALERAGVAENTIVVFTSEHGDMVGTHHMLEMRNPCEEAASVPLLVRIPWLTPETRRIEGNFSQIDFVPTLLDLLNQPVPTNLHGQSRAATLTGDTPLADDVIVQHNGLGDRDLTAECESYSWPQSKADELNELNTHPWRSIITPDRWKLTLYETDRAELYDLNTDPLEQTNLIDDPSHHDRVRELAQRLHNWQQTVSDPAAIPSPPR